MRNGNLLLTSALTLAALATPAWSQIGKVMEKSAVTKSEDEKPVVVIDTSLGAIAVELDRSKAPITVDNFLKYVDTGFYDGLVFHRVIPGFMIQGGGMTADAANMLQEKRPSFPPIKNESRTGLSNARGTIAMARTDNPNSATSQFFINHADNSRLDHYGGGYTAFGTVVDGMDVVDAIAKVKTTDRSPREEGVPDKPVVIKSAKRKPKA